MTRIRPLEEGDIDGLESVPMAAFRELEERRGHASPTWDEERRAWWRRRMAHLLRTDPTRQWVGVDGDEIVGVAAASVREGLWGLSLLTVFPGRQGAGLGRLLLDAALGDHTGPGIICSSDDGRALRRYAAAGFALYPCLAASGRVDLAAYRPDARVVEGFEPEFADAVDRVARGAGHGPDHVYLADGDAFRFRFEDGDRRAYARGRAEGYVNLVAGTDAEAARAVLWAACARTADLGVDVMVGHVTGGQQWAMDVAVAARLHLDVDGAVCWRGRPEPVAYLPNGAFL